jgi:hypothetical protein
MSVNTLNRKPSGWILVISLLGLVALMPGCNDDSNPVVTPSEGLFSTTLILLDASGQPKDTFQPGEEITFHLKVTNLTSDPQTLELPSSQIFEFLIADPAGVEIWRWSHGQGFAAVLTPLEFAPLQTREYVEIWNQTDNSGKQVAPGTYDASGLIPANAPGLTSNTVRFENL